MEARAEFARELSVIAARGRDGAVATYPLGENHHENGILRRTRAPAVVSPNVHEQAEAIAARILTGLDYVGVAGVELFGPLPAACVPAAFRRVTPAIQPARASGLIDCAAARHIQHIM